MALDPIAIAERSAHEGFTHRALQELASAPAGHATDVLRAECLVRAGQLKEAQALVTKILAVDALDPSVRVRAVLVAAHLERSRGEPLAARRLMAEVAPLADDAATARLECERARLELLLGRHVEVERVVDRAVWCARRAVDERVLAEAWLIRAWSRLRIGDREGARVTLHEVTALVRRIGHEPGRTEAALAMAHLSLAEGDLALAEENARWSLERAKRVDDRLAEARALDVMGEIVRARRDPEAALRQFGLSIRRYREAEDPALWPRLHSAQALLDLGRHGEASAALRQLLDDVERTKDRNLLGVVHALLMACAVSEEDSGAWERHLADAEAILLETGVASPEAAQAARAAGLQAGERGGADDLARAARCHGLALVQWRRSGLDQQAVEEGRSLRRWSEAGAAIPCGEWNLLERIGHGAMGEVWRARHHVRGVEAAVKLMIAGEAGNRRLAAVIAAEVRAVAGLHHPHIVEVLDHGQLSPTAEAMTSGRQRADTPWFAMTLARGGTLEPRCGRMPWADCRRVLLAILDALAHAHARGVVHLDIKPGNVLLDPRPDGDRVLLTDFGLTGALQTLGADPGLLGTPHMMSPEQFREQTVAFGPWTDLYALGCLATHLVQGSPPFPGRTLEEQREAHLHQEPPPLEATVSVPLDLEDWVARLMAKRPADRFPTAADAAWALQQLGEAETVPTVALPRSQVHLSTLSLSHLSNPSLEGRAFRHPQGPSVPLDWHLPDLPRSADHAAASLELFRVRRPPMVGQEAARDRAWASLASASSDGPRGLWVQGAHGAGKTRFVEWLRELAHERGAALTVSVAADARWWHDLLEPFAAQHMGALGERLSSAWPELEADAVDTLMDASSEAPALSAEHHAAAFARLVSHAGARRAILICVTGRPIAPELRMVFEALMDAAAPVMVAVEGSSNEPIPPGTRWEGVALGALSDADLDRMVRHLVPLEASARSAVVHRAAGNPQLAVELLTDLVDRRLLVWSQHHYELSDGGELGLPTHVRDIWRARLERALVGVVAGERPAVVAGALLGDLVLPDRWDAVCSRLGVRDAQAVLQRLERSWLVEVLPDHRWRFIHPVLRGEARALAERDGDLERACLVVARFLSSTSGGADAGRIGQLLAMGGELDAALAPLALGLAQAVDRDDVPAAEALLDERADVLRRLGAPPDDPRRGTDALARAELALRSGDLVVGSDHAAQAVSLSVMGAPRARAHLLQGHCARRLGRLEAARDAYAAALATAGDEDHVLGHALFGLGEILSLRGDLEAAEVHLEMARATLSVHREDLVAIDIALGIAVAAQGRTDDARVIVDRALDAARTFDVRRWVARALTARGQVARWADRPDDARDDFVKALAMAPQRDKAARAELHLQLGLLELALGRSDAARSFLDQAERDADERLLQARLAAARLPLAPEDRAERALARAREAAELGLRDPDLARSHELFAQRGGTGAREALAQAADIWRALARPRDAKRAERALAHLSRRQG